MKSMLQVVIFIAIAVCPQWGRAQSRLRREDTSKAEIVVQEVIQDTLKRGEGVVEGYKVSTWVPVDSTDRKRIVDLGMSAVAPLTAQLSSNTPFVQLIAVQLLGSVGGKESVAPLRSALGRERWVVVRMQALSSLMNTPDADAIPLIASMREDGDMRVRQRADEILTDHYGIKMPVPK